MKRKLSTVFITALIMICLIVPATAFVTGDDGSGEPAKAKRTILLYCCGADLESDAAMATHNFKQILDSKFSADADINFIIMTGGANFWQLDKDKDPENDNDYLVFPENVNVPDDAVIRTDTNDPYKIIPCENNKGRISGVYNQIWEARGADAALENGDPDPNAGKLVLRDGDGISGQGAVKGEAELMSDPATLKAFINYGVANYPAEKYDLILWDHGGGPMGGFGYDEHFDQKTAPEGIKSYMSLAGIMDALSDNDVTKADTDGDGKNDKFDFVNFDACLMGNVDLALILSDYTRYYIASADTEPGYGQYYGPYVDGKYSGWLDELGDPDKDDTYNAEDGGTFELGKVIVNDYYTYYTDDDSPGKDNYGTLAVFDTEKMITDDEFMTVLSDLTSQLKTEAETVNGEALQFFDELKSAKKTINYAYSQLFDLADLAAFLGVADAEEASGAERTNAYSGFADKFNALFPHPDDEMNITENKFMYAKCTLNEKTDATEYHKNGKVEFGFLFSTGLTVFFPDDQVPVVSLEYFNAMNPALEKLPQNDNRRILLEKYKEMVADYATILITGKTVSTILNNEKAFYPESNPAYGDRSKVKYDLVMSYWKDTDMNTWDSLVVHFLNESGVGDYQSWLTNMITQMVDDALVRKDIDVTREKRDNGYSYKAELKEGNGAVLASIGLNVDAELPVLTAYINSLTGRDKKSMSRYGSFSIGTIDGFNNRDNEWIIPEFEQKWYVLNDEAGSYHVASIYHKDVQIFAVPALFGSSEDGKDEDRLVFLEFSNNIGNDSHELKSLYFAKGNGSPTRIDPRSLTGDLHVMPILYVNSSMLKRKYYAPISREGFVINSGNASDITLDHVDVRNIPDIEDTSGDGEPLKSTLTTTDLYGYKMDISQCIDKTLIHISQAVVEPGVYTGKELVPKVSCNGKTLIQDVDYTWEKVDDVIGDGESETFITPEFIKPGVYADNVLLTGIGQYTGFAYKSFTINKAANKLEVKSKTAKVRHSKLKKKNQQLDVTKVIKFINKGQGTKSYAKVSGNRKITINKKTGNVIIKKGLKKGSYKVKVTIKAKGDANYKGATKPVTFSIKVR